MNRRQFLGGTAFVAASSVLSACSRKRVAARPCILSPVRVSEDREIRTVVGLRPFRAPGFVVRTEKLDHKLLVHNYGHGGGGIALSWGTAKLALDASVQGHSAPVAVLGCGAVGFATARLLQEAGFSVTIYAKDLLPNTTSNIASGQWFPSLVSEPDRRTPEFMDQFTSAATFAYNRYQTMIGPRYGVRWIRNYALANDSFPEHGTLGTESPIRSLIPEMRDLQPSEHPFIGYQFVRQFDTMLVEPPIYLNAMIDDFRRLGGVVRVTELHDRRHVSRLPERLVFNCTGLGAKTLFGDDELTPVKGQLTVLLPQPELDYAVSTDHHLNMFPRTDGILLGGTHQSGVWSLEPDEAAKRDIIAGHKALFANLKDC